MKYRINYYGDLVIENDSYKQIFAISKYNNWGKWEYNHKGKEIYFENSSGSVVNL